MTYFLHHKTNTKSLVLNSLVCGAVFLSSLAFAADQTGPYVRGEEADKIEVFIPKGSTSGTALVTGCSSCPLKLNIDANTKFFYQGKKAGSQRIVFLSGKPGTVVYIDEQQRVTEIIW